MTELANVREREMFGGQAVMTSQKPLQPTREGYTSLWAVMSNDGRYRYALSRRWGADYPYRTMYVVGLNPSTADAFKDDPTIRRCVGFAKREMCRRLIMLNLFAYRSTDPDVLEREKTSTDIVGTINDVVLETYTDMAALPSGVPAPLIVCAWGARHERYVDRVARVVHILKAGEADIRCFGTTARGAPRHPLYLRDDTPLEPFAL